VILGEGRGSIQESFGLSVLPQQSFNSYAHFVKPQSLQRSGKLSKHGSIWLWLTGPSSWFSVLVQLINDYARAHNDLFPHIARCFASRDVTQITNEVKLETRRGDYVSDLFYFGQMVRIVDKYDPCRISVFCGAWNEF
jgi:hypothetical protein